MNQAASRKDIDDVIDILHVFMKQVSDEFGDVKQKLEEQGKKYDRLATKWLVEPERSYAI